MSNNFYNHSGYPNPNAAGSSAALRAELDAIGAGFEKMPTLAGNGYKVAMISSDGLSLIASAALQSLAITGSTIDSTIIGATTKAAGSFTNLVVTGTASLGTTVVMGGGTIDNTIIGGTTRAAGYFTTLAANSGITGNLTGNVTGNLTGNVTGNVTGDLSGNVSTTSGTSSFNNVTIIGTLDMSSGTAGTITGLSAPTNASDAATKSYVDTADALKLNLSGGTMSGAIAMGTSKITGLGDPTANQDAATKAYVDSVAQGLDAKASVRVATTANITLSNTQTIDGIALSVGDRVLVKDQSTASQNGIYVVASGSWTRATDADTWVELTSAFTFVEQGTANANNGYTCTIAQGGTIGTTAITWVQFSGAGQITAGAGLTKTGNTLDVGTASSSRIVVNANDIDLATTGVTIGTYAGLTVDAYGRVTSASTLTTLAGYGITNAYTKTEVDTALALKLNLTGGTMSGNIAMGSNKVTGLAAPSAGGDATNKTYVDAILGSATAAATSAAAAAVSESNAANSATAAAGSATAAAGSATSASNTYTTFNNQYLGSKATAPALNNSGGALVVGNLYWNSTSSLMYAYDGAAWIAAYVPSSTYLPIAGGTMTGNITLNSGTANGVAYLNGSKVLTTGSALTFDGTNLTASGYIGAGTFLNVSANAGYINFSGAGTASAPAGLSYGSYLGSGIGLVTFSAASQAFYANSSEQMRLTSTGLGIGTSSPISKLHVNNASTAITYATIGNNNGGTQIGVDAAGLSVVSAYSQNPIRFGNNSGSTFVETMRLDASGNLGLGVTPSASSGSVKVFEIGSAGNLLRSGANDLFLTENAYFNSGWKYGGTGAAAMYELSQNTHAWYTAPSGTAGNAITFTQAMTLDASGYLLVGLTSHSGYSEQVVISSPATVSQLALNSVSGYNSGVSHYINGSAKWYTQALGDGSGAYRWYDATAGSERARIDSSGNVGIGVTPSAWGSAAKAIQIGNGSADGALVGLGGNDTELLTNAYWNSGFKYQTSSIAATRYFQSSGIHAWLNAPSGTAGNAISFTQAMTLDASGNLLVGQTNTGLQNANTVSLQVGSGNGVVACSHATGTASGTPYAAFGYGASNAIGSITQSGTTAVLYNVTSDQRLKENIVDAPEFGSVIDSIKVRSYDWKADGNHQRAGFIAQELVTVAPEAVHQPADPEEMMAVDYSKLVPMLVKEIQSLRARLAAANIA